MQKIFCFRKLERGLRGEWSDRCEIINNSVFFETFSVFNLPGIKGMSNVFVVNIDGNASLNLLVEGIGLDVMEFGRGKS